MTRRTTLLIALLALVPTASADSTPGPREQDAALVRMAISRIIEQRRELIQRCAFRTLPRSIRRIRATLEVRASTDVAPIVRPLGDAAAGSLAARCLAAEIQEVRAPAHDLVTTVALDLRRPVIRLSEGYSGRRGDICHWGAYREPDEEDLAFYPQPAPCRAGLACCATGGAAGRDMVCLPRGACRRDLP